MNNNTHPCAGKCGKFKNGEQCMNCLINETAIQGVYSMHRTEHQIDHIVEPNDMGDDAHIENHISPLCKTESQPVLIVERDNQIIERLKVENVVLQAKVDELQAKLEQAYEDIETFDTAHQRECEFKAQFAKERDELQAENKILNQAAATHLRNQHRFKGLYDALVEQLYPYALDLNEPVVGNVKTTPQEFIDGYNRALECVHYNLLEMMESDVEYIRAQCDMFGGEA